MLIILVYSFQLNLFKYLWKKITMFALNTIYQKYHVGFIRPLLKKSNISFPYYAILFLLTF